MLQARWKKMTSTLVLVGAAIAVLAGCGGGVQAGPAPSPTWSCTPDTSGEPCTPEKAAAYEEAMHAYREFTKERNRLMASGGLPSPANSILERYAAGDFLDAFVTDLVGMHESGLTAQPGVVIHRVQPVSIAGEKLAMRSCEDGRGNEVRDAAGQLLGNGTQMSIDLTAQRLDARWVITGSQKSEVEICD